MKIGKNWHEYQYLPFKGTFETLHSLLNLWTEKTYLNFIDREKLIYGLRKTSTLFIFFT